MTDASGAPQVKPGLHRQIPGALTLSVLGPIWRVSHIGGAALAQFLVWVAHDASVLEEIAQLSRADDSSSRRCSSPGPGRSVWRRVLIECGEDGEPPIPHYCK